MNNVYIAKHITIHDFKLIMNRSAALHQSYKGMAKVVTYLGESLLKGNVKNKRKLSAF